MTQEDKELLLKDFSARLPYGVFCNIGVDHPLLLQRLFVDNLDGILLDFYEDLNNYQVYLSEIKPYLRPMSSMTEEEVKVYNSFNEPTGHRKVWVSRIDYLNSIHIDYRGLIEMRLALEAPKDMYD